MNMALICIKAKEYIIFHDNAMAETPDLNAVFDMHFEVDELLALPIAELNKKGYLTSFSCSGHPFFRCLLYKNDEEDQPANLTPFFYDKDNHLYYYASKCSCPQSYIAFQRDYKFEKLPEGWFWDEKALRYNYPTDLSDYELFRLQIKAINDLYIWICSLNDMK